MSNSQALIDKARTLADAGKHAELVSVLVDAPVEEIESSPALALLYGTAHVRVGRPGEGMRWVERAVARARECGDEAVETRALNARGGIAFVTGQIDEAADFFTQALMAASRDGDHTTIGRCSNNLGAINNVRGRYAEALGSYSMAIGAFSRVDAHQGLAEARHNLAITYKEQGEFERAVSEAESAHEAAVASGDRTLMAMTIRGAAEHRLLAGDVEGARRDIQSALDAHRELSDATEEAEDLRVLAAVWAEDDRTSEAEHTLRDVISRAENQSRLLLVAEATRDLAYLLRKLDRDTEASAAARTAIKLFEEVGAEAEVRKLDSAEWDYPIAKELRRALKPLRRAQKLADAGRYVELMELLGEAPVEALRQSPTLSLLRGIGHTRLGQLDDAQQWVMISLSRARALGDRLIEVRALNVYGAVAIERGGIDEARGFFMRAQAQAMESGDMTTVGRSANNLGVVADLQGDHGRAVGAYTMAIAAYQRAGYQRGVAESQHNLGMAHREGGRHDEALRAADQAVHEAMVLGDSALSGQALAGKAEVRLARNEVDVAILEAERAVEMHRELGDDVRESEDLRILAAALGAAGRTDEAKTMFEEVIERAEAHARPLLVAAAQRDLALLLDKMGCRGDARPLATNARETFDRMGARKQVQRLDDFLTSTCTAA